MKQVLIRWALLLKSSIPEKYHFYLIGFLSYIYQYIYAFSCFLSKKRVLKKYEKEINSINSSKKDIFVFMPTTDWNDLKQRPQHLAKAFAEAGKIVIFLTKNQTKDNEKGINLVMDNFYLCSNLFVIYSIENANLIFTGPSNYPLLKFLNKYTKLIYDFPDELDFFPGLTKKIVYSYHLKLLEKSNLTCPSASFLQEIVTKDYPAVKSTIILNGVFPEDFEITKQSFIPEDLKNIIDKNNNKKIVGFYGGLGEKWIDFELIKYSAINRPEYVFIIIGGGNLNGIINKYGFEDIKNVYFLGARKYEELRYYAKNFDVACIPFLLNDFTLGVSPIKSFEYMVQGLPFVSTALPECKKYKNVLISDSYEDYVVKLDEGIILKNDKNYIELLKKEGSENTWISRAQLIIKNLS